MANQAGLNIIVGWDDSKVQKGVEELKKLFSNGGGLSGLSIDSSGTIKGVKSVSTAVKGLYPDAARARQEITNLKNEAIALALAGKQNTEQFARVTEALNAHNRALKEAQSSVKATEGPYAALQKAANDATRKANDLGAALGVESKEFLEASKTANEYTQKLKDIDAASGRHQRNVGNYASGYNAISVNMARIVGEMPNFAQSMRIGFMAISNNIQPLAESIQELNRRNRELAAQGKPTASALKTLGSALFSWNTLLLVGVTALTAYGPKLVEWIKGLRDGTEASKRAKQEQEALNKATNDAYKSAGNDIAALKVITATLESNTASAKTKKNAYADLVKISGDYGVALDKEYNKTLDLTDVTKTLTAAIIINAQAKAKEARIAEIATQNQIKDDERFLEFQKKKRAELKKTELISKGEDIKGGQTRTVGPGIMVTSPETEYDKANREIDLATRNMDRLTGEIKQGQQWMDAYANDVANSANALKQFNEHIKPTKEKLSDAQKEAKRFAEAQKDLAQALAAVELKRGLAFGGLTDLEAELKKVEILTAAYVKFRTEFNAPLNSKEMLDIESQRNQSWDNATLLAADKNLLENRQNLNKNLISLSDDLKKQYKKDLDDNVRDNERAYEQLLKKANDYYQQKQNIEQNYEKQNAGLQHKFDGGGISVEEFDRQKDLILKNRDKLLSELAFNNAYIFKKLNADIGRASIAQLQDLYKTLGDAISSGKMLDRENNLIDIPPETLERLKQARIRVSELLKETQKFDAIGSLAPAVSELGQAFQDLGGDGGALSDIGGLLSGIGSQLGNLTNTFKKIKTEGVSSMDAIAAAAQFVIQMISMVVSSAAQRRAAERQYEIDRLNFQYGMNNAVLKEMEMRQAMTRLSFSTNWAQDMKDAQERLSESLKNYQAAFTDIGKIQAKLGQRNAVDWGRVGSSTLSGVAAGAAIGSVVPVIGTAIGAVVGGVVGFVTGLFGGKKKKDQWGGIFQEWPELMSQTADGAKVLNVELAKQLIANNLIDDKGKVILQNIIDQAEEYQKAFEEIGKIVDDVIDDLGDNLRKALNDAFRSGESAANAFKKTVSNIIEELISQAAYAAIFEPLVEKLKTDMKDSYAIGGDMNWVDDLMRFLDGSTEAVDAYTKWIEQSRELGKERGLDLFAPTDPKGGKSVNDLQGAYAQASQQSIDLLSGHTMGMRVAQLKTNDLLQWGFTATLQVANFSLDNLVKIETNTYNTVARLDTAVIELKGINTKLGDDANKNRLTGGR